MSERDGVWFGLAGAVVWLSATFAFVNFAAAGFGAAPWQHLLNVVLVAGALCLFFPITARVRRMTRRNRALAALAFSAPGLIASAVLAVNAQVLMPAVAPAALARYVALALAAYALVLAQAMDRPVKRP